MILVEIGFFISFSSFFKNVTPCEYEIVQNQLFFAVVFRYIQSIWILVSMSLVKIIFFYGFSFIVFLFKWM
jgi:hypothetical protein